MTTADSPEHLLRAQATLCAKNLKAMLRGEVPPGDTAGKVKAALLRDGVTFAIVMDDKLVKVSMPWEMIRETDEAGLVEWILAQMQGKDAAPH